MSGDVALVWDSSAGLADFVLTSGDFASDEGLRTALELSLFCDRRAEDGDVLPDGATDRRGWWADAVAEVEGDRIGSRLWLLARAKNTPDTIARAEEYTREACAWLLADKVAESVSVSAEFLSGTPRALGLTVTVKRPTGRETAFKFRGAWSAEVGD